MTLRRAVVAAMLALPVLAAALGAGWFGVALLAAPGCVVAVAVTVATAYRPPAPLTPAWRPPPPRTDPVAVAVDRCVGTISWAQIGPREADTSLRPALERVADTLVDAHTGQGLRADRAAVRRLVGDELFAFIDPRRPTRSHDDGVGLSADEVDRMLTRLEELT